MNDKVLPYPEKPSIECMPTLLDFAISGWYIPKIVVVNENLLADDLSLAIGDEIDLLDVKDKYDLILDIDKTPFRFVVILSFDVIEVKGWYMIEVTYLRIEAEWNKEDLIVKWSEESLRATLENQTRIMI